MADDQAECKCGHVRAEHRNVCMVVGCLCNGFDPFFTEQMHKVSQAMIRGYRMGERDRKNERLLWYLACLAAFIFGKIIGNL